MRKEKKKPMTTKEKPSLRYFKSLLNSLVEYNDENKMISAQSMILDIEKGIKKMEIERDAVLRTESRTEIEVLKDIYDLLATDSRETKAHRAESREMIQTFIAKYEELINGFNKKRKPVNPIIVPESEKIPGVHEINNADIDKIADIKSYEIPKLVGFYSSTKPEALK